MSKNNIINSIVTMILIVTLSGCASMSPQQDKQPQGITANQATKFTVGVGAGIPLGIALVIVGLSIA